MSNKLMPTALLLGNFIIGTSVVAPAGILNELSTGLDVSIPRASSLIALGAVVLCIGSPLMSWLTSSLDRRLAMAGAMFVIAAAHIISAFVTTFDALLVIRLAMLLAAAYFTPQAASMVGIAAAPEKRAGAIAYVFIGWSFAIAIGVPLATVLASRFGWPSAYLAIGAAATISFLALMIAIPTHFKTPPVDLKAWSELFRSQSILILLLITAIIACAKYMILTFIAPLLVLLGNSDADGIGIAIGLFGIVGIIGSVTAARVVGSLGPFTTSLIFAGAIAIGMCVWSVSAQVYAAMLTGVLIWGFGFSAINSLQQARLVLVAPELSGGAVALNTSVLYIGQAIGSAVGGVLFERGQYVPIGYLATGVMIVALGVLLMTKPHKQAGLEVKAEA